MIVTGSIIPTAEEVGANPVYSLNRDLINKSGQSTTVEELMKAQPVISAGSIPVQNNATGQAGPSGTAALSLRGFDPGASLVLIDGRRVAPFPGAANSAAGFVDLVSIPIAAVQSIEILKDGASTTYGADAVAGVVNLKFYKDYRGAQLTLFWGNTLDKDAEIYSGDILFGTGDDKTSVTGDIFFYHHNSMFNHDRGNSIRPPFLSSNAVPWNLQLSSDVVGEVAPNLNLNPGGVEFITPPNGSNGLTSPSDYVIDSRDPTHRPRGFGGVLPGFNFNAYSGSFPDQERWGGYAAFEHKVCDDQLRIFGDFYYVDAKTHDELAPTATGPFETPGKLPIYIPPNHPLPGGVVPPNTPTPDELGAPPNAFNPFNPFEQFISGGTEARIFDFGNRLVDNENVAERFTIGVKGDRLFNGTWGYDGAFVYSQITQYSKFQGITIPRLEQIMNANDPIFNPSSASFIGQTIPYNPMVDSQHVVFPSNLALIDFARLHTKDILTSKLATLDLNVYTTDLFDLPAGGVGLAFGGVFSRETYIINPDDANRLGENADSTAVNPVQAGRKSWAIYAETLIPIFSPKWNIPGFHSLEASAGVRYEEWLNNDTSAALPKVGIRWQPFDEQFTMRSTWGEGFLEPSMLQLYGPNFNGLGPTGGNVIAPPGTTQAGQVVSATNPESTIEIPPNKRLSPEHDRNWTGGIVYTPKWIPSKYGELTITVDFWDVERNGIVAYPSAQDIIADYNAGKVPAIITPQQARPGQTAALFDPAGDFIGVASPFIKGSRGRANGVDLGLQYQLQTKIGLFSLLVRETYLNEFVFAFPGQKPVEGAGRDDADWSAGSFFGAASGSGDGWYKWKGIINLDWTWHNIDLNWTVHQLDGLWEQIYATKFDGFFKQHYIHPTWFTDAQLSYTLAFTPPVEAAPVPGYSKGGKEVGGKEKQTSPVPYAMPCWKNILNNTTWTIGVNNIWGEDPPHAFGYERGNALGYPGNGDYTNEGRFWYMRLIKKF